MVGRWDHKVLVVTGPASARKRVLNLWTTDYSSPISGQPFSQQDKNVRKTMAMLCYAT